MAVSETLIIHGPQLCPPPPGNALTLAWLPLKGMVSLRAALSCEVQITTYHSMKPAFPSVKAALLMFKEVTASIGSLGQDKDLQSPKERKCLMADVLMSQSSRSALCAS